MFVFLLMQSLLLYLYICCWIALEDKDKLEPNRSSPDESFEDGFDLEEVKGSIKKIDLI